MNHFAHKGGVQPSRLHHADVTKQACDHLVGVLHDERSHDRGELSIRHEAATEVSLLSVLTMEMIAVFLGRPHNAANATGHEEHRLVDADIVVRVIRYAGGPSIDTGSLDLMTDDPESGQLIKLDVDNRNQGLGFDLPPLNSTISRERIWGWSKPREATNATRKEGTG